MNPNWEKQSAPPAPSPNTIRCGPGDDLLSTLARLRREGRSYTIEKLKDGAGWAVHFGEASGEFVFDDLTGGDADFYFGGGRSLDRPLLY